MERHLGVDLSAVRLHTGRASQGLNRAVSARAFTSGTDVFVGDGTDPAAHSGRELLAHELTHVAQQATGRAGAGARMTDPAERAETEAVAVARQIARQEAPAPDAVPTSSPVTGDRNATAMRQATSLPATDLNPAIPRQAVASAAGSGSLAVMRQAAGGGNSKVQERVVSSTEVGSRQRTVAEVHVVGHASPRWRSARGAKDADQRNMRLAEQRADMVRLVVEGRLRTLLPDRDLVFEYVYACEVDRDEDPLNAPADVRVESEGRGSTETLGEAGPRGRTANDDPMRRVEVTVRLLHADESEIEDVVARSERKSAATRDWEIWVGLEAGVEIGAKVEAIMIVLRRRAGDSVQTAQYWGWASGGGATIGVSLAKTDPADFESFRTSEPMGFADFSGARFMITSIGAGIGAFGVEWAKFRFLHFAEGREVPEDSIQVGGISFGGIEANLGTVVYGTMLLTGSPDETYVDRSRSTRSRVERQDAQERIAHRVLFATGSSDISGDEGKRLEVYVAAVASGL